jgi:hydroxymethylpyrimidine kinase/phosphomethylpyrimidine kinase
VTTSGRIKVALTIAGSDPSGGAGIQSDLKTFSRLRVYGMAVIAALTAQNTRGVSATAAVAPDFVGEQLDAVLSDIPPAAIKTGMLLTADVVAIVVAKLKERSIRNLVVDPVMVSTSGTKLLNLDAIETFRRTLLPLALLVTPNMDEASVLTGRTLTDVEDMEQAALHIHGMGAPNVLVKGGHGTGPDAVDVFFDGSSFIHLRTPRVIAQNTHGTGCVLSAAIAAHLARGLDLEHAVRLGKDFVTEAIQHGLALGTGKGPCDPLGLNSGTDTKF